MGEIKPVYLLAGGWSANRSANDLLLRRAFSESGKKSPSVGYVGTANRDNEDFFIRLAGMLRENGAGEVRPALISPDGADISKAEYILRQSDIICISGGDVNMGIQKLEERGMVHFLVGLYQEGKPFFGLSAGSIMLADEWVRWRNPDDDATAEVFPCLGIAPVLCDTHDEEGGWAELKVLLMLGKDGATGYGIAAGTALMVFPDGGMEALGGAVQRYVSQGSQVRRM
ncbi:MAG: Type 1 glutamine amidotransferase-like domain-containing protein, partial [Methanosarcinaceae archaeon]|nr:Type 1 glutamine amidotransferase-like domain-containing protein [Methanosarcinaceae archaeon]